MPPLLLGPLHPLATGLALVPLAWAGNKPGHKIEPPMAIVFLSGLVASMVLNLGLMPALYLAFGRTRGGRPEDEEGDEAVGRFDGDWSKHHIRTAMATMPVSADSNRRGRARAAISRT